MDTIGILIVLIIIGRYAYKKYQSTLDESSGRDEPIEDRIEKLIQRKRELERNGKRER